MGWHSSKRTLGTRKYGLNKRSHKRILKRREEKRSTTRAKVKVVTKKTTTNALFSPKAFRNFKGGKHKNLPSFGRSIKKGGSEEDYKTKRTNQSAKTQGPRRMERKRETGRTNAVECGIARHGLTVAIRA